MLRRTAAAVASASASRLCRVGPGLELVLVHGERCRRGARRRERVGGQPGVEGGLELGSEPCRCRSRPARVWPVAEALTHWMNSGDVDLGLALGQSLGAGGVDAQGVDPAGGLAGFAVPPVGLVAAPRGGDRGDGQEHGGDDLDPVPPPWAGRRRVGRRGGRGHTWTPASSQGIVTSPPITVSCWSMSCSVRSIAVGLSPPMPVWNGWSRSVQQQQHGDDHGHDAAHEHGLHPDPLAAVGEPEEEAQHDGGDEEQRDPHRRSA